LKFTGRKSTRKDKLLYYINGWEKKGTGGCPL